MKFKLEMEDSEHKIYIRHDVETSSFFDLVEALDTFVKACGFNYAGQLTQLEEDEIIVRKEDLSSCNNQHSEDDFEGDL